MLHTKWNWPPLLQFFYPDQWRTSITICWKLSKQIVINPLTPNCPLPSSSPRSNSAGSISNRSTNIGKYSSNSLIRIPWKIIHKILMMMFWITACEYTIYELYICMELSSFLRLLHKKYFVWNLDNWDATVYVINPLWFQIW